MSRSDTIDYWAELIQGDTETGIQQSTILLDDKIIGHITEYHYAWKGIRCAQCGWDLHPDHWGNGYMTIALTQRFVEFIDLMGIQYVFADCLQKNHRCISLQNRLGFSSCSIPILDRLRIALSMRSLSWDLRFELYLHTWSKLSTA